MLSYRILGSEFQKTMMLSLVTFPELGLAF